MFRDQTNTIISEVRFIRDVFHKGFVWFSICRSLGRSDKGVHKSVLLYTRVSVRPELLESLIQDFFGISGRDVSILK